MWLIAVSACCQLREEAERGNKGPFAFISERRREPVINESAEEGVNGKEEIGKIRLGGGPFPPQVAAAVALRFKKNSNCEWKSGWEEL